MDILTFLKRFLEFVLQEIESLIYLVTLHIFGKHPSSKLTKFDKSRTVKRKVSTTCKLSLSTHILSGKLNRTNFFPGKAIVKEYRV